MKLEDLKIEAGYPKHPGGQSVGMPTSAVRVLHVPTGLIAVSEYERSQLKNKRIAMAMIEYGLAEMGWVDLPAVTG